MSERRPALVIDASAAMAVLLKEPNAARVRRAVAQVRAPGGALIAPSLLWLEVVNALGRRRRLPPEVIVEAIADLDALAIETVELDRPMLLLALDAVARHGLTAYDAAYLALADAADARLLTADARLAAAAGPRAEFVGDEPPSHELAEAPAPYTTSWADWPGAAAYLRQLRARAATG